MNNSLVGLEMAPQWQDDHALHVSRQYFAKANLWRDIFPTPMNNAFSRVKQGAVIKCELGPGELFQPYDAR